MSYLLDTCIISKLRVINKRPNPILENWIDSVDGNLLFISSLTLGEIQKGISKLNTKKHEEMKKKVVLEEWFFNQLIPQFHDRILPMDTNVFLTWGKLAGEYQQRNIIIPFADGLLAATALTYNLTVVTDNIKDFCSTGVRILNPCSEK